MRFKKIVGGGGGGIVGGGGDGGDGGDGEAGGSRPRTKPGEAAVSANAWKPTSQPTGT